VFYLWQRLKGHQMLALVSPVARAAIHKAVEEGDSIHELEHVGVPERVLNILDTAGVIYLEQLIHMTVDDLIQVQSVGEKTIEIIRQGLQDYHLVAPLRTKRQNDFRRIVDAADKRFRLNPEWHPESENKHEDFEDE
jgi:DNA-directed RNA polymerase alpha subunit